MTDLLNEVDAPSDAELISRVRGGDVAAYGDLFARHVEAARRLSRQLVRGPDSDDLVSDAFAKVLHVLQGGGGPDVAFRAYLLTAVRRLHVDRLRSGSRLQSSDDIESFDAGVPFQDTAVAAFESGAAAKAFASLPERWQLVLWHLEVEGQKPADVAPLLGMSPNSVSALAYRAREGLRQAFLTMHLNDISDTDCRWVNEHLGAYVRNGLAKRESTKVRGHLDECRRCTAMYLELTDVNSNLAAIIAPLLLGAAAAGYLASTGTAAGGLGLMTLLGRARDAVSANAGAATVGAVAAGVAAVATAGIMLMPSSGPDTVVGADDPIGAASTPADRGGSPAASEGGDKADDPKVSPGQAATSPAAILPSTLPSATGEPAPGTVQPAGEGSPDTGDGSPGNGPSEPGANPTEPGPTEPGSPEPNPTDPPPSVEYELRAGSFVTISNAGISFDVTGDPLPPKVYLKIDSAPAGITFSDDGTCDVRAQDNTVAVCDTGPVAALTSAPLTRAFLATSAQTFVVTMPLAGTPPSQDTDITVRLSAPEGVVLDTVTARYDVTEPPQPAPDPAPTANVGLALAPRAGADDAGSYSLTGSVTGIPVNYRGVVEFALSGNAVFQGSDTARCLKTSATLITCNSLGDGYVDFNIDADNNTVPTPVTISVAALDGYHDPDTGNNVDTSTLEAFGHFGLRYSVQPDAVPLGEKGGNEYQVSATVAGIPADAGRIEFELRKLTGQGQPTEFIAPAAGCTSTADRMTCNLATAQTTISVQFTAKLPSGQGILSASAGDETIEAVIPDSNTTTFARVISSAERTRAGTSDRGKQVVLTGGQADVATRGAVTVKKATKKDNLPVGRTPTIASHIDKFAAEKVDRPGGRAERRPETPKRTKQQQRVDEVASSDPGGVERAVKATKKLLP